MILQTSRVRDTRNTRMILEILCGCVIIPIVPVDFLVPFYEINETNTRTLISSDRHGKITGTHRFDVADPQGIKSLSCSHAFHSTTLWHEKLVCSMYIIRKCGYNHLALLFSRLVNFHKFGNCSRFPKDVPDIPSRGSMTFPMKSKESTTLCFPHPTSRLILNYVPQSTPQTKDFPNRNRTCVTFESTV